MKIQSIRQDDIILPLYETVIYVSLHGKGMATVKTDMNTYTVNDYGSFFVKIRK